MQAIAEQWTKNEMRSFLGFFFRSIIFLQIAQDSVQLIITREITDKQMTQWGYGSLDNPEKKKLFTQHLEGKRKI